MKSTLAFVFLALGIGLSDLSHGQVARMEILTFQSMTLTDESFLAGRKDGKPVIIAGELRLPRPGTDRLPTVVLLHGSGGISGYVTDWEQEFNAMGIATFVVDSFSARGITSLVNDQSQLGRMAQIFDSYRAFETLEKHPRVDPARIAVMGFSRGGQGALYSGMKRFQRMHGPASGREFAAYVALYPTCNTVYIDDEDVTAKPIRIFHGSADNYVPVAPCRAYAQRLKARGADIQHTEYAGALHVFDWSALKTPTKLEKAQTTRSCQLEEVAVGRVVNASSKQLFTWADPCVEYGVTSGYDETASTETRKAVRALIGSLKP
jgi:dienelactone hydrolase